MNDISLLIIDEAHRAVKGYAYTFIAEQYVKFAKKPLLLALTASPGSTRQKIQEVCTNLHIQNIEVKTETDEDVKNFVNMKKVFWEKVKFPESYQVVHDLFKEFMKEKLKELKDLGLIEHYNVNNISKKQLLVINKICI